MVDTIGKTAGKVWTYLGKNGEVTMAKLVRDVGDSRDLVQRSIGWLAREDKLDIRKVGRSERIRLK